MGCTVSGMMSVEMCFEKNAGGQTRGCKYRGCILIVERIVQSSGGSLCEVGSLFSGSAVV